MQCAGFSDIHVHTLIQWVTTHTQRHDRRDKIRTPPPPWFSCGKMGEEFSFVCAPSECCLSSACVFALSATNGGNWVCVHVDDYTNNQAGTGFNGRHIILGIWWGQPSVPLSDWRHICRITRVGYSHSLCRFHTDDMQRVCTSCILCILMWKLWGT